MMIFHYYKIYNKKRNKTYIGITEKTPEHRFKQHYNLLINNEHPNYKLQADWNEDGENEFIFEEIETLEADLEDGYNHEYELIQSFSGELYNIAPGGQINIMYSPEVKNKMIMTKQSQVPNIYNLEEIEENQFKIVQCFPSQKAAGRAEKGWSQANIQRALRGHYKAYGYFWVEEQDIINNLKNWVPKRLKMRPTALLDENKQIAEVHHNARVFEQIYSFPTGVISGSIYHNQKYLGKTYKYITEEEYYQLRPITLVK